jgi:hypothetical protein
VPLKKTKRNRYNQEDNTQLLMPSSINLIDLDIPDYYSEAKVTLRLFSTSFLSKEMVSEKIIRMRELFQLSSLRDYRSEMKEMKTSVKEKGEKNSFSQYRFGWNSVKIPSPIRTENNVRSSKLSPLALFSIFSTWNFLTTSSSTSTPPIEPVPEIRTEKTESASKTKNPPPNLNPNLPVNDGNSVDGNCVDIIHYESIPSVEIFLRSRLVPVLSCVTLQSMDRFNIMNRTEKNGNNANNGNNLLVGGNYDNNNNNNNNNNKEGNNESDDNGDVDGENDEIVDTNTNSNIKNDNNNNDNTEPFNTSDPPLKNTEINEITEKSPHTRTVEKQSELHFLVSTCNSAAARTVMSVLGDKKFLKAALLLTDSNSCNALDVALERGEECVCVCYICYWNGLDLIGFD